MVCRGRWAVCPLEAVIHLFPREPELQTPPHLHPQTLAVRPPLRLVRKVLLGLFALCLVLVCAALVLVKTDWFAEQIRVLVVRELSELLDAEVHIGRLSFKLLPTVAVVQDVTFRPRGKARLFAAQRIEARLRPLGLLRKQVDLERVLVDGAELTADVLDGQLQNLPKLPKGDDQPSAWKVELGYLAITRTDVHGVVRGSDGAPGESLRQALGILARFRARPGPTGATTMVARVSDLEITVRHAGLGWEASLVGGAGSVDAPGLHESLARLRLRVATPDSKTVTLEHLEVVLGATEVAVLVRGVAHDLPALLTHKGGRAEGKVVLAVDVGAARKAFPGLPRIAGMLKLDIDGSGASAKDFRARGRIEWDDARLGPYNLGDVRVGLAADPAGAEFEDLRADFLGAQVRASGRIGFEENPPLEARLNVQRLQLGRLLAALEVKDVPVDLVTTGTVEVKGRLVHTARGLRPDLVASTQLAVRDLLVHQGGPAAKRALFVADTRIDGRVDIKGDTIRLEGMNVVIGRSALRVRGLINHAAETISIDAASDEMHLESVGTIAGLPWGGNGTVRGSVRGTFKNVHVLGSFDLRSLSFAGYDIDNAAGQVDYANGVLGFPVAAVAKGATLLGASATLDLEKGLLLDADVEVVRGNVRDILRLLKQPALYGSRYAADLVGDFHLRGAVENPTGWGKVTLSDVTIRGEPIHEIVAKGAFTDKGWLVEEVRLRKTKSAGVVLVKGTISRQRELDLHVTTEELSLAQIDLSQIKQSGTEADVELKADLGGTLDRPLGKGKLFLRKMVLRGQAQHDSVLDVDLIGDRIRVVGKLLGENLGLTGDLKLAAPYVFQSRVAFKEFDVAGLVGGEAGKLLGKLTGGGDIHGSIALPDSIEGKLVITEVSAELGSYRLQNKQPVRLSTKGLAVRVESFQIAGRDDTDLTLTGRVLPTGALDLEAEGKANFKLLSFFAKELQQPAGGLAFKVRIGGTLGKPTLLGAGTIADGSLGVEAFPHRLTDVVAKLQFTQNKVLLRDLTGRFADGTITGEGELTLARPTELRFAMVINEAALRYPEDFPSTISGRLLLAGTLDEQKLSGDIKVHRARYSKDFKLEELVLKKTRVIARVAEKKKERLQIDVRITAADDIRVVNNIAELEFQADLHVRGSNRGIGLVGGARLVRPGTAKFRKSVFKVERAFAVWKEGDPIDDPYLDLEATTRVRQYDIVVSAKARRTELAQSDGRTKIDISCGAGLSPADCISLMQINLTLKELNAVQPGKAGISYGVDALGALTGFDEKVAEALPIFDTFRIGSGYSEYSATIVPLVTIGKDITKSIRLFGTTSLIEPSKDFRALLEFDLAKNLSLTGEYVNLPRTGAQGASVGNSLGNLGVDLRWRFEF